MDQRTFGVEIECGIRREPGSPWTDRNVQSLVWPAFERAGLGSHWTRSNPHPPGYDGTEFEIKTPVLKGATGFKELRLAMDAIKSVGGYVTGADGMHVHHGCPEVRRDKAAQIKLVKSWTANHESIVKMVHESRRNNYYCHAWHPDQIRRLEIAARDNRSYFDDSYHSLTLRNLNAFGTIEIRLHHGCLDADDAIDWIKFGQAFIRNTLKRKRPIRDCADPETLLKRLKIAPPVAQALASKAKGEAPFSDLEHPEYAEEDEVYGCCGEFSCICDSDFDEDYL